MGYLPERQLESKTGFTLLNSWFHHMLRGLRYQDLAITLCWGHESRRHLVSLLRKLEGVSWHWPSIWWTAQAGLQPHLAARSSYNCNLFLCNMAFHRPCTWLLQSLCDSSWKHHTWCVVPCTLALFSVKVALYHFIFAVLKPNWTGAAYLNKVGL